MRRMDLTAMAILGLGLFASACFDSGTGPNLRNVAVAFVSGDRQVGQQNTELPQPLVVEGVDRGGVAVTGARIALATEPVVSSS